MIEIAPKEYHSYLTFAAATLYCWSLVIDGKRGWRLPTEYEIEQMALPNDADYLTISDSDLECPYDVIPVRDVT